MGKLKFGIGNIENINPESASSKGTSAVTHSLMNMRTRSSKTTEGKPANTNSDSGRSEYPASALIQDLATTASAADSAANKSPLTETSHNDQTPEKDSADNDMVAKLLLVSEQQDATPTTNLKILCEAVDHDESTGSMEAVDVVNCPRAEPVTPTANLKMLITAASPEIRSLELSKSRLFTDDDEEEEEDDEESGSSSQKKAGKGPSTRKMKSLGILCRRFMAQFDEFPPQTSRIEVCLDELASHLGTERRRIYDIVNVLESVEMMSRRAKNRYLWHGKTNLNATLVKLKYYAETEQVAKQLELVKELEMARLYGRKSKSNGFLQSEEEAVQNHPKYKEYLETFGENHRKERSLGVMSQKFLMLFLTGKTKTINLDMAAKLLLGDPMVETKRTNSQFKTKIRRLYDIANILASLNLICKVHVTELRGRKPAFSYIGPDVEELSTLDEYQYLKEVEVARPGRTTLDMKMEELKRKMEAHIAAEKEANLVKQVPPVQVEGPDMAKLKQGLGNSNTSLSHLAGELVAKKKPIEKERPIRPKSPMTRPFVVIQGAGTVIKTSKAPGFMETPTIATAGTVAPQLISEFPLAGLTFFPLASPLEGNQLVVSAQPANKPSTTIVRKILPQPAAQPAAQPVTATVVSPVMQSPSASSTTSTTTVNTQQKRTASEAESDTSQREDNSSNTFFLTKSDNEYFLIHKKAKTDTEDEQSEGVITVEDAASETITIEVSEDKTTKLDDTPPVQIIHTPITSHSSTPVPLVYSTPSNSMSGTQDASAGQITIMASPIVTPTSVSNVISNSAVKTKQPVVAIRKLALK